MQFIYGQGTRAGSTLQKIRIAHELQCGVVQEDAEYSTEEDHSSRGGFDEALCQAYATAAGTNVRVKVTSFLDEVSALDALRAGKIDVIATLSADASHPAKHMHLSRPVFYDSLGLLVPVASGIRRPQDLAGKKICVLAETGTEETLRSWYAQHGNDYLPFPFQEEGEMEAAYASNNCAALAAERTRLSLIRVSFGQAASQHVLLNEPLSQDAMASATRTDDPQWTALVDQVARVMLLAEQLHITSATLQGAPGQQAPSSMANFTKEAKSVPGLRATWALDVVRRVGNYGEMYERTLGSGSDRQLPRDLNRPHEDGGLLSTIVHP